MRNPPYLGVRLELTSVLAAGNVHVVLTAAPARPFQRQEARCRHNTKEKMDLATRIYPKRSMK